MTSTLPLSASEIGQFSPAPAAAASKPSYRVGSSGEAGVLTAPRIGENMYASVRKYGVDADRVGDLMHRVDEKFAPRVEEMPGFIAYQAIDAGADRGGEGRVFTVTICSDRDAADRSAEIAAEFVQAELGDIKIERLEAATGSVGVSRAVSEVLEAAHA